MGEYLRPTSNFLPEREDFNTLSLHVYNETDPLRTVALWGPPGPEAVLAQLLPQEENLFYSSFNVRGARREYARLQDFLHKHGTIIILIQDQLVKFVKKEDLDKKSQPLVPKTVEKLISDLENRALVLYKKYGIGDLETVDLVPELVYEDVKRLGEEPAILLNWMLSLRHMLPSGNIFYGRDQSNVLGDKIIWSQMRWPIRKPEVGMYKTALEPLIEKTKHCRVRGRESFLEGGDGIMVNGDIYLGVGGRTTLAGAYEVYQGVEDYLRKSGKQMILVVDEEAEKRTHYQQTPGKEQEAMHLDTFWMPFGDGKKILCCLDDVDRRRAYILQRNGPRKIMTLIDKGRFTNFLEEEGFELFPIPKVEQLKYATNFLNIDEQTVIVPFSDNSVAMRHFQREGISILPIEMTELGGGYGAIHCMTTALKRE